MKKLTVFVLLTTATACGFDYALPEPNPSVRFVVPEDGAHVPTPVHVELEAKDLLIEPSGSARPGAGYFVIVLDFPCIPEGETIPFSPEYVHMEDGARRIDLTLERRTMTLCLQAASGEHVALGLTDEIVVHVE